MIYDVTIFIMQVNCLEPHPNCPVLATSGLDHDVKIWSPTSNQPTNLDGLDMTMSNNERERAEEKCMPRDPVSERLFRMLMRHARRHRVRIKFRNTLYKRILKTYSLKK